MPMPPRSGYNPLQSPVDSLFPKPGAGALPPVQSPQGPMPMQGQGQGQGQGPGGMLPPMGQMPMGPQAPMPGGPGQGPDIGAAIRELLGQRFAQGR